jgi:sortase A
VTSRISRHIGENGGDQDNDGTGRSDAMKKKLFDSIERLLLVLGLLFLVVFVSALIDREVASRRAIRQFEKSRLVAVEQSALQEAISEELIDFSLWSEKRVRAYQESLEVHKKAPLAVISLARLNIRAPVFEGTDDLILNRGLGWIAGTARPGDAGNVAIAGHRDGFFRALKDVVLGDRIELFSTSGTVIYAVEGVQIVTPENVGVLRSRDAPSLTLVTCYPFYFIGPAPQRFVVQAILQQHNVPGSHVQEVPPVGTE